MLKGDNYKPWKELILLQLGCMDLDYAIRNDEPAVPIDIALQVQLPCMNGESDLIA